MKRYASLLAAGVVATGLVTAFAHDAEHKEGEEGKPVTVIGELIDTACFVTSTGDAQGKEHAQCATKCLRTGVPAGVLPAGSKDPHELMFLLTNPIVLAPYSAQTIKVEGKAFEQFHAIDPTKVYVKVGDNWKEIPLRDEHHKALEGSTTQPAEKQPGTGLQHMGAMQHMSGMQQGGGMQHKDHQH